MNPATEHPLQTALDGMDTQLPALSLEIPTDGRDGCDDLAELELVEDGYEEQRCEESRRVSCKSGKQDVPLGEFPLRTRLRYSLVLPAASSPTIRIPVRMNIERREWDV